MSDKRNDDKIIIGLNKMMSILTLLLLICMLTMLFGAYVRIPRMMMWGASFGSAAIVFLYSVIFSIEKYLGVVLFEAFKKYTIYDRYNTIFDIIAILLMFGISIYLLIEILYMYGFI